MRNTISKATAAVAVPALAGQLSAGGLFLLVLGNVNAVLTIQAAGCQNPATATLSATAIGTVGGQRREIPLKVEALSSPGMFALAQQWPGEGRWVIKLAARNGAQFTSTLVAAGAAGIDRFHGSSEPREFTAAEVDAMLK